MKRHPDVVKAVGADPHVSISSYARMSYGSPTDAEKVSIAYGPLAITSLPLQVSFRKAAISGARYR